jgi:hypothetical protein
VEEAETMLSWRARSVIVTPGEPDTNVMLILFSPFKEKKTKMLKGHDSLFSI